MLGTLCTFLTSLTCVHGVIVLTQKPSVQTKTTGEEVTMDCNIGRFDGNYVHWYKQVPGGVPHDELKSNKVTLVCLASQMAMGYADVSWTAGENPVTGDIATSGPVPQADKTFQLSSCLTVDTSEWNQDKVFSCKVTVGSKFAEKGIKKSECSTE